MSDRAAAEALTKLASEQGNAAAREKVAGWLLGDENIRSRVDPDELGPWIEGAAGSVAGGSADAAATLEQLKNGLQTAPGTTLVALFRAPEAEASWKFGRVEFGPPASLIDGGVVPEGGQWGTAADETAFAIRVEEPAIGSLGQRRALNWLRAGLGALYLAGRIAGGGIDTRLGPVPADDLAPSIFVGAAESLSCLVEVMRVPASVPLDVDALLSDENASEFVADCLREDPAGLVEQRLRQAAPWVEFGFDALAFPDAVLGLGVALESLIGSESPGDVVRVIGLRTGFLLREGHTPGRRALSGSDWRALAERLYGARSKVAHGRYEEGALGQAREREIRQQFEDLVCRVAASFRAEGKNRSWETDKDLRAWQVQLEMA